MRWTTRRYAVVDEKNLAETIINLMKDEGRLYEMCLNGRRIAEAHCEEEFYIEVLEDI